MFIEFLSAIGTAHQTSAFERFFCASQCCSLVVSAVSVLGSITTARTHVSAMRNSFSARSCRVWATDELSLVSSDRLSRFRPSWRLRHFRYDAFWVRCQCSSSCRQAQSSAPRGQKFTRKACGTDRSIGPPPSFFEATANGRHPLNRLVRTALGFDATSLRRPATKKVSGVLMVSRASSIANQADWPTGHKFSLHCGSLDTSLPCIATHDEDITQNTSRVHKEHSSQTNNTTMNDGDNGVYYESHGSTVKSMREGSP